MSPVKAAWNVSDAVDDKASVGRPDAAGEHNAADDATHTQPIASLVELLDRVEESTEDRQSVSLGNVMDKIGKRSFVPWLTVPGIIMAAPVIGDIPGVPVMMGILVILIAGQILLRRDHLWLPDWMLKRSVSSKKVTKTIGWIRRPAGWMDRWTKPRYQKLVHHAGMYVIASVCIVIAAATPLMEVVPMSANIAGLAITAFGLALLAHDGLIAMVAIALSLATIGTMLYQFL